MTVEAFIAAARSLKGAQWRHLGRSGRHVDCIGLLALAFARAGIHFDDERVYSREPVGGYLRAGAVMRWGDPITKARASAGDIVLLRWGKQDPSHTGILAAHPDGGLSIIHATQLHGVIEQRWAGMAYAATSDVFRWHR